MAPFRVPTATYRVQLRPDFGFGALRELVPYLYRLGITDIYTSPILRARQGSDHGYDVTDPTSLNPELGSSEEFEALVRRLRRRGMGLLVDIAPNHMAASPENPWWVDVLENGRSSRYASYFDIHWETPGHHRNQTPRIVLPVLRSHYREVLTRRQLSLSFAEDSFFVEYRGLKLPLDPKSYAVILSHGLPSASGQDGHRQSWAQDLALLARGFEQLPPHTAVERRDIEDRHRRKERLKGELRSLYCSSGEVRDFIERNVGVFNGTGHERNSLRHMDELLHCQTYRLEYWRSALNKLNYRRFFDISDLIGIRVEEQEVFEATHAFIFQQANQRNVTGVRIDHIDGLYDPLEYLLRLQSRLASCSPRAKGGSGPYVVVEKILTSDEGLPRDWPVSGTTGYDFLNSLNGVFVEPRGIAELDRVYRRFVGSNLTFADVVYDQKKRIIGELFAGELRFLVKRLYLLARRDREGHTVQLTGLRDALREVTACCPVYRTYIRGFRVARRDRLCLERAFHEVDLRNPDVDASSLLWVRRVLLLDFPFDIAEAHKAEWLHFVMTWQQFTGPVMAKGLEDTALYLHNGLVSLNEVGGVPGGINAPVAAFHHHNRRRLHQWPQTLNATSTHDTKRSEDLRARINVLSEMPDVWENELTRWSRLNAPKKHRVDEVPVPDPNEEILLYQTLLGTWPFAPAEIPLFKDRIKAYVVKAAREAKVNTSWVVPHRTYEKALTHFVDAVLEQGEDNEFLVHFIEFQKRVAFYGMLNGLAQALLKIVSPGIPDTYQGAELWDFSMVDPDNRRPVDFATRASALEALRRRQRRGGTRAVQRLLAHWEDGLVKLYVTSTALNFRRTNPRLFQEGDYVPVRAFGSKRDNVVAFARQLGQECVLAVVPRLLVGLVPADVLPVGVNVWGGNYLRLPGGVPGQWVHVLTGERLEARCGSGALPLSAVFERFPVALLSGTASDTG